MPGGPTRLELYVDVFEKVGQKALVLPNLTPLDLVAAILREYSELEYLGSAPGDYHLIRTEDASPLDGAAQLATLLRSGDHLALVENELALPAGTRRPSRHLYLREQGTGTAYRLAWQPAIIGRIAENQPDNAWVAVDLTAYPTGLRVSRRHVRLDEEDGGYYIENLSGNPVSVTVARPGTQAGQSSVAVTDGKQSIHAGDLITLDRSGITLKFVIREERNPATEAASVPAMASQEELSAPDHEGR